MSDENEVVSPVVRVANRSAAQLVVEITNGETTTEIFLQPSGSAKLPPGFQVSEKSLRANPKTLKVLEG